MPAQRPCEKLFGDRILVVQTSRLLAFCWQAGRLHHNLHTIVVQPSRLLPIRWQAGRLHHNLHTIVVQASRLL